jgi:Flp pilus assembly protein TadD
LVQAGNINSNDSKLHLLLGEVCLKLGKRDEAFREYETLRELDPSLADALAKLLDGLPKP